ncbi:MAG: alpha/beta hydrolase [Gemmatimonadetes bacterium]|nr:alpha/beta hydrolase [Gemmatimonadota bacterium]
MILPEGTLLPILGFLSIVYGALVLFRNRRLVRPPIVGTDGAAIGERAFTFTDGEKVDYVVVGPTEPVGSTPDLPSIFLVPGADGMKETFRYQVPALARRRKVVCASLRRRLSPEDTFDRLVDDVAELAGETTSGRFVLLGQSLGGAIAMRFAIRWPDRVAGLALSNTLAHVGYDHVGLNRVLLAPIAMATTRYLPTGFARILARAWSRLEVWIYDASPGSERVVDYALWTGPRTVPSSVSNARVERFKKTDLRPELSSISAPTLVLKGPRDHYVPPAASHEIVSLVPGAMYAEVAGSGHCSHLSMSASFNSLLLRWLATVVDGAVDRSTPEGDPGSGTEVRE